MWFDPNLEADLKRIDEAIAKLDTPRKPYVDAQQRDIDEATAILGRPPETVKELEEAIGREMAWF